MITSGPARSPIDPMKFCAPSILGRSSPERSTRASSDASTIADARDTDRERRRNENEVRVCRREHREGRRETEGTTRRDRAAAHIVSRDREAVADDRARRTGREDRGCLCVGEIELAPERLEAARDEESGRLVGHPDREQRDEHRRRMSRRGRCPSEEGGASIVGEPSHPRSVPSPQRLLCPWRPLSPAVQAPRRSPGESSRAPGGSRPPGS